MYAPAMPAIWVYMDHGLHNAWQCDDYGVMYVIYAMAILGLATKGVWVTNEVIKIEAL